MFPPLSFSRMPPSNYYLLPAEKYLSIGDPGLHSSQRLNPCDWYRNDILTLGWRTPIWVGGLVPCWFDAQKSSGVPKKSIDVTYMRYICTIQYTVTGVVSIFSVCKQQAKWYIHNHSGISLNINNSATYFRCTANGPKRLRKISVSIQPFPDLSLKSAEIRGDWDRGLDVNPKWYSLFRILS